MEIQIGSLIKAHLRQHGIHGRISGGEARFKINEHQVRRADLAYIGPERAMQVPRNAVTPFVPDLVVEVISPGDRFTEVRAKARRWLPAGVQMVWLVNLEDRSVIIATTPASFAEFNETQDVSADPVIPGFRCPVRELFSPFEWQTCADASFQTRKRARQSPIASFGR